MNAERYQEFVDRILAEGDVLDTHYMENPELAHSVRMADAQSILISYGLCHASRAHWDCLITTSGITRYLYALAFIKPQVLDEIYEDFKEDFQAMLPEGTLTYKVIECRDYPVPDELLPPQPEPQGPSVP